MCVGDRDIGVEGVLVTVRGVKGVLVTVRVGGCDGLTSL